MKVVNKTFDAVDFKNKAQERLSRILDLRDLARESALLFLALSVILARAGQQQLT